jgi:ABC-type molybdate transport system ATPase subunit
LKEVTALIKAMEKVECDFDATSAGILPGMFALVAHDNQEVREFAQNKMLATLGKVQEADDVDDILQMWTLIDSWV